MAQRKRKSTKKVSTKRRTSKKRTTRKTVAKKRTAKRRSTKKRTTTKRTIPKKKTQKSERANLSARHTKAGRTTSKRKSAKRSLLGSVKRVKVISNEIKRLTAIFVKSGEDAIEDRADLLEDKIKKLTSEGKISEEQAKKLNDELDILDD